MGIIKIDGYLDGGTIKIVTTDEIYCIDSRIKTKTKGYIYLGYPKGDNSNIVSNQDEIKIEIKNALEKYTSLNFDWKPAVYELLNSMEQKKLVTKINKIANEISKNRKSEANYIHLGVESIQKKADERKVSFDEMVKIIEKELMPNG